MWFQELQPGSMVMSNYFDLNWYTSNCGVIIHLTQLKDGASQPEEFQKKLINDVEVFKKFFAVFTFVVCVSSKYYLSEHDNFRKRKWTPLQIARKMQVAFNYTDGHGVEMQDFSGVRNRRAQNDWLNIIEVPDANTRNLLNQLLGGR